MPSAKVPKSSSRLTPKKRQFQTQSSKTRKAQYFLHKLFSNKETVGRKRLFVFTNFCFETCFQFLTHFRCGGTEERGGLPVNCLGGLVLPQLDEKL